MLDIKKITTNPNNVYEAVTALVNCEQHLIEALHIMESIIEFPDYMDCHIPRLKKFLIQFQNESNN